MSDPKKRPFVMSEDLRIPGLAITKEQHDAHVEATGRPFTDDGIKRRTRTGENTTPGYGAATEAG